MKTCGLYNPQVFLYLYIVAKIKKTKSKAWKKLNNRQIVKTIELNKQQVLFVIAPKNYQKFMVPLFCPFCRMPMISKDDIDAYKKNKLCEKCFYHWYDQDLNKVIKTKEYALYLMSRIKETKPKINLK